MNRRTFLNGLGAALGLGLLSVAGCGTAVDSNTPEEKPATPEAAAENRKVLEEGRKAMGKGPK